MSKMWIALVILQNNAPLGPQIIGIGEYVHPDRDFCEQEGKNLIEAMKRRGVEVTYRCEPIEGPPDYPVQK